MKRSRLGSHMPSRPAGRGAFCVLAMFLVGILVPVLATAQGAAKIRVSNAWARASAGPSGAAYLSVENTGAAADRLVSAATEVAEKAAFHTSKVDGEVMRMRPVDAIEIPPQGTVTLEPGGNHVMLMGLKEKLVEGESFPLTLVFEKSGRVTVPVTVRSIAAMGPGHGGMGRMKQPHGHR